MDDPEPLHVRLLGPLTATCGGRPLDLGGPRQRAVLARLLLARGEVVAAETLVEAVWPDRGPADPAAALQAYISHLRRRLEPGAAARSRSAVIAREGRGYAVRLPRTAVDAWQFEDLLQEAATADPRRAGELLTRALGLWSGPALADYADEPWAAADVGRLTELRATARERLLAARLELGEAALLVPDLEVLVAEEPLREERWRLLALALYQSDRQADALAALRRARGTLADELGVDPGPSLRQLEDDVLTHAPTLRSPPRPRARAAPDRPAAIPSPRPGADGGDDLEDRTAELAALRAALDELAAGRPRLLLVEGPAGIGKTRLLAEARRLAAGRSFRVLTARGSQLEKAFGFGVVRQLFEPELRTPERGAALLGGAAAAARGVFDLSSGEPPEGSFALLHGLYWLAVDLAAEGPLLLAVDDLQWSDRASLGWLAYLVRRLDGVPVLVVATVRTGERHEDEELLTELELEPAAVVVRPEPLSPEATERMVGHRLGQPVSPLFARACHGTTAGNPLLVRQLLRALEADGVRPDAAHADLVVAVGSRAISSMVLMRLRRLPEQVLPVAQAAAVLGDGAPLPAVATLAEQPERETAAALALLSRVEILRDEWPLGFVHPLVREAIYRDLPAPERALLHERAAQVLAGGDVAQVAAHLLLAPRRGDDGTVALLRRAAREAADRGSADTAVTLLRRALEEPPGETLTRDVLTELGLLESTLDGAAGTEHLLQAYALHDDPRTRARLAVVIGRTHVFASPPGVATAFAREAALVVPAELADHRQALRAIERISGFMHGLDPDIWRTADPPQPAGDGYGARMLAATLAFETTVGGTHRDRAVALARFALAGDRLWTIDHGLFWVVAANARMLGDDDLGDFWQRARAQAHARGSLFTALSASVWEGFWRWRRGELTEALGLLAAALDQDRMWRGIGVGAPYARAFEIGCRLDQGDVAGARRAAEAALAGPHAGEGDRLLHQAVARLLVAERRFADALAALDAVPTPVPIPNPAWNPWRGTAAAALHGLGRDAQALALAEEEVALLRRWGAPTYLGTALRRLGQLRGGSAGLPLLREAVEVLAPTHAALELARARFALGATAELPDAEAVPLLRAASEAAADLGAEALLRRACSALTARGRPDGHRPTVRRASRTEREVLDLAAGGATVREIAQRLFLTPGTVQAVLESGAEPAAVGADGPGLKLFSSAPPEASGHPSRGVR